CASVDHSASYRVRALDEADQAAIYRAALGRYLDSKGLSHSSSVVYVSLNGRNPTAAFLGSLPPSEAQLRPVDNWKHDGRIVDVDAGDTAKAEVEVVVSEGFHRRHRPNQSGCSCTYSLARDAARAWSIRGEQCALLD